MGPAGVAKERAERYQGRVTFSVVIACLVAAVGGALFGYDTGISGNFCARRIVHEFFAFYSSYLFSFTFWSPRRGTYDF